MQIPESKLETVRGKVIGIGRVKIPKTSDFDYEIPLLSFIVIEKKDGGYPGKSDDHPPLLTGTSL